MTRRIDLNDVYLLMQVVEHGSYTATARAIGTPKSTISQRIAQLEATIGTGLLRRSSRSLSLTEVGARLVPHARAIEEVARDIDNLLADRNGELEGTLRISSSIAIGQFVLAPIISRFLAKHERIAIRVVEENRVVDIIGEGYDMIVRGHIGPLKDSALVRRLFAPTRWILAASPGCLDDTLPGEPEDLAIVPALCFPHMPDWRTWRLEKAGETRRIAIRPRFISDDMLSLRALAIDGAGIVYLPSYILQPAIDRGDLIEVLPEWRGQSGCVSVLTPPKAQSSPLADAFARFLAAELPPVVAGNRGTPVMHQAL